MADVGLFLFSDALVLTRRNVQQIPFSLAVRSSHTFLASVALTSLTVREITHTRCRSGHAVYVLTVNTLVIFNNLNVYADVSHAFVLEGPRRSWVCATERDVERDVFLSVLRSAINTALAGHH